MDLYRVTPDREQAASMQKMVETTLQMIRGIDHTKYASNVTKENYEVIRELISIILLLDGYKVGGEGAHKRQVEYLRSRYKEFERDEIVLIDELRMTRNRISYDGFFVKLGYLDRKLPRIQKIIETLRRIIRTRLAT